VIDGVTLHAGVAIVGFSLLIILGGLAYDAWRRRRR
jgi:hypothetical protein